MNTQIARRIEDIGVFFRNIPEGISVTVWWEIHDIFSRQEGPNLLDSLAEKIHREIIDRAKKQ